MPTSARIGPRAQAGKKGDAKADPPSRLSLPMRGKAVSITNQLRELNERKDRMEMNYYEQKNIG